MAWHCCYKDVHGIANTKFFSSCTKYIRIIYTGLRPFFASTQKQSYNKNRLIWQTVVQFSSDINIVELYIFCFINKITIGQQSQEKQCNIVSTIWNHCQ